MAHSGSVPAHKRIQGRRGVALRKRLRAEQPLCSRCLEKGRITATRELHHKVPLSIGGSNDPSNMEGLCVDCHLETHMGRPIRIIGVDGWPIDDHSIERKKEN